MFFAAQLLAYLKWSNLGIIAAVKGAKLLEHQNGIVLILGIIVLSAMVNMLIGSASAKWNFRTDIRTNVNPYRLSSRIHTSHLPCRRFNYQSNYTDDAVLTFLDHLKLMHKNTIMHELGALLSSLMPYSIALSIVWTVFVIIWFLLGIPVGPGGPISLNNSIQRE